MLFVIGLLVFIAAALTNAVLVIFSDVSLLDYASLSSFGLFREAFATNLTVTIIAMTLGLAGMALMFAGIIKAR